METIAFRMALNPGMREEYARRHREIWPELVDALHDLPVMRKWWDMMADIMQTAPDRTPFQQALVPVFELPARQPLTR